MVTLDRIRLTGLLRKKPWKRGFFYSAFCPGTSYSWAHVPTAVSLELLGAGAQPSPSGCAGFASRRTFEGTSHG
jgi:hypothetical protein